MKAFEALKSFLKPTDSTIALPGDPFVVIDRERAIEKLKLNERAEENAKRNFPPADSEVLDDVELEIVAEIGEHAKRAQIDASGNHKVYAERLSELALLRELSTITGASAQALGDYKKTVFDRQSRLTLAKDSIKESYQELATFKRNHRLERPAHRGIHQIYAYSGIALAWFAESAANTAFLKVNDDFGLLGGFVAAAIVAAVNVFISAVVGRFWWPYLWHKNSTYKGFAISGCALWAAGLVVWNLIAGHFRDAKGAGMERPEEAALHLFAANPLQFDSIYSYGLLVAGITFAVLAATAAYKMDDPYPGYGDIYRRHEERCEDYADEIELAMEELQDIRDDAIESANDIRKELGAQFRERGQILAARQTQRTRYREHQDYLEDIANFLLGHYRAANTRNRPDGATPLHFRKKWELKRTDLPADNEEPSIDDEVVRAQQTLQQSVETIAAAYQDAIEKFEHLDQIKRSLEHG